MSTGLSGYTPQTKEVKFPGGAFTVRGLSAEDFTVLLHDHYAPMAALFDRYVNEAALERVSRAAGGALDLADMKGVVLAAAKEAPALFGDVIARVGSGTPSGAYPRAR